MNKAIGFFAIFILTGVICLTLISFSNDASAYDFKKKHRIIKIKSSKKNYNQILNHLKNGWKQTVKKNHSSINSKSKKFDSKKYIRDHKKGLEIIEKKYGKMIRKIARELGIPEKKAIALACSESDGDAKAKRRNKNGSIDVGLFQANTKGAGKNYTMDQLLNPETNTRICLTYYKKMYDKFGDWDISTIAFKKGPNSKYLDPKKSIKDDQIRILEKLI